MSTLPSRHGGYSSGSDRPAGLFDAAELAAAAVPADAASGVAEDSAGPGASNTRATARVSRPERRQVEMRNLSLNQMLPEDDRARQVWDYVNTLDLSGFYARIVVTDGSTGRSAIAPEILLTLWLTATLDGIGHARELDRRCDRDMRYLWICGGVGVNHHTLSDFRVDNVELLDRLLVDSVAVLVHAGVVPLETIAQDGMRVRAGAGRSSFRRAPTLEQLQKDAQEHLDRLKKEAESAADRQDGDARRKAAKDRAARERKERVDEAVRQHKELADQREQRKKGEGVKTRCSTTDPDARNMKTPTPA